MAICVQNTAKEVIGETKSSVPENKETWRDEEIQRVEANKKNNLS